MGVVSISKMPPYLFRNFRCIDKTVMRPSYFYYGNAIPRKTVFILKRGPDTHIPELVWAEEVLNTMLIQPCLCDTDVSVLKPKIFSIGVNPLRASSVFSSYYHFFKEMELYIYISYHSSVLKLHGLFRFILRENKVSVSMGLLPDTQNCGLRMHQECRERFPRHQLQRKPLVSDPGMRHGTCRDACRDR